MKYVFALILALVGCAAADYSVALDKCALDHRGDKAGREACQCDVSKDAGRSCDWIAGADQ